MEELMELNAIELFASRLSVTLNKMTAPKMALICHPKGPESFTYCWSCG